MICELGLPRLGNLDLRELLEELNCVFHGQNHRPPKGRGKGSVRRVNPHSGRGGRAGRRAGPVRPSHTKER